MNEVRRWFAYQPALDGLRAVALVGVVGYHAGVDWLRGGFLGVSTFFTLSGFLITTLLLRERSETGTIALGSFWERRIRRLLPAAMVTVVATTLVVALLGDDSQLARLRGDAFASVFHFSNWHFVAEGDSYGALFQSPSFFRHFWSLAVEEQYYFVVPALLALALRTAGGASRRFAVGITVVGIALLAWPAVLLAGGASTDRIYFGTDGRLGELALGALFAVWWSRRTADGSASADPALRRVLDGAALAAVGVTAALWATAVPTDRWLYRGGLALHAALTVVVLVAAMTPGTGLRRVLSVEPLRRLGVISYGGYLLHWPILLVLQQETTLQPAARFAAGLAITIPLASLMHRYVETPIRHATGGPRRILLVLPATGAAAAVILVVAVAFPPAAPPIDFAQAQRQLEAATAPVAPVPDPGSSASPATGPADSSSDADVLGAVETSPASVPTIAMFGDSTALMTGLGVAEWAREHPGELRVVRGTAKLGCGLLADGTRILEGRAVPVTDECTDWLGDWLAALDEHQPTDHAGNRQPLDLAMIQLGAWEIVDHRADDGFTSIMDDGRAHTQKRLLEEAVEALHERARTVVLIAHPDVGEGRLAAVPPGVDHAEYNPARAARWREIVHAVAATRDDTVVVDLAAWIHGHDDDLRLRPDGVHFSTTTAREVADWLVPQLLAHVDGSTAGT